MNKKISLLLCATLAASVIASLPAMAWAPKKAPIETQWASKVNPQNPLPEYPRPQMARPDWLNLNGIWEYQSGAVGDATPVGKKLTDEICVPYPVESALSGVMEHHDRLWYRRSFTVPTAWKGKEVMLNFGAVDYEAEVFVNGKSLGVHTGGYEAFSYDITPYLEGTEPQELIVRVFDPTEKGGQPRGKQTNKPGGIMYTPTTGIWQTVWLEPIAKTSIASLKMIPDVDNKLVHLTVNTTGAKAKAVVTIKDSGKVIKTVTVAPNVETSIPIKNPKLWSPEEPFLYDVNVKLMQGKTASDTVDSYFGMRKISLGDVGGIKKMLLNNQFVFEMGALDQGFWPEGIYTAPTDEALRSDIEMEKRLGFNLVRKHIKIEPARWYYWADHLGILVWQDMPSPNSYDDNHPPIDKPAYEKQLREVITTHWNSPAIIMWVVFNESQGRHDTPYVVSVTKQLDPSRLVDRDSGSGHEDDAHDGAVGDVDDVHSYPPPGVSGPSPTQALVCGEYGSIGYTVKGHLWKTGDSSVNSPVELEDLYGDFSNKLKQLQDKNGLSAAVVVQITDVETETNGMMTYDRVLKCDPTRIALANHFQYPVPTFNAIVPTSETTSQTWRYTFTSPTGEWKTTNFDDSLWQSGPGGFGTQNTPGIGKLGTPWNTPDIWLRRTFNPGTLSATQMAQLVLHDYHDEDLEVYINGILAYKQGGFTSSYEFRPLTAEGKAAIKPNADNILAVHCHQTGGGQYVDVGISQRIPPQMP
ncbi:beta-galactosidase BoGH2A [Abditibacteriota bacterium]|nr:beta-galactosidase BoGH2A [Abditibacteriota bacterium]